MLVAMFTAGWQYAYFGANKNAYFVDDGLEDIDETLKIPCRSSDDEAAAGSDSVEGFLWIRGLCFGLATLGLVSRALIYLSI